MYKDIKKFSMNPIVDTVRCLEDTDASGIISPLIKGVKKGCIYSVTNLYKGFNEDYYYEINKQWYKADKFISVVEDRDNKINQILL